MIVLKKQSLAQRNDRLSGTPGNDLLLWSKETEETFIAASSADLCNPDLCNPNLCHLSALYYLKLSDITSY